MMTPYQECQAMVFLASTSLSTEKVALNMVWSQYPLAMSDFIPGLVHLHDYDLFDRSTGLLILSSLTNAIGVNGR